MAALFADGTIIDLVLGLTVLEALALAVWFRRSGRGIAPADVLGIVAPGLGLMLALRAALTGADWRWVALCMLAALAAHLIDLRRRWR